MAKVTPKNGESFESLLKRFKRQVVKEEILQDIKKNEYYVAPSLKRRLKHENALKRDKKKVH